MGLSGAQKQVIAAFAAHFESAVIGLQHQEMGVPTLAPQQYQIALAAGLYALSQVRAEASQAPGPGEQADFSGFIGAAAVHYAENLTRVAVAAAHEALESPGAQGLTELARKLTQAPGLPGDL